MILSIASRGLSGATTGTVMDTYSTVTAAKGRSHAPCHGGCVQGRTPAQVLVQVCSIWLGLRHCGVGMHRKILSQLNQVGTLASGSICAVDLMIKIVA